jgi:branched-chain amino acid transport system substrate-binding protein
MNRRRQLLGGLVAATSLSLMKNLGAQPKGTPIRVGATLALTGPLAATTLIHRVVAEIMVEQLNKKNGILGRPVEWVLLDDQSKPDVARSLYERLITVDKVDLILGPYGTGAILAAMPVAQRYGKLLIQGTFGLPHLANYEMQFPASPIGPAPNKTAPPKLLELLAATRTPPRSIAVVTSKFPSAQFISAGMRDIAPTRGLKVPLYLEYEFGTRDYGPIASRIKEANPDVLWVGSLGLDSVQLLAALKGIEYTPPRHFHLFPAPGPLAVAPEGDKALAYTFFEEHAPFTSRPGVAEIIPIYRERAKAAGIPYPFFDFQAAAMGTMWQMLEQAATATKSVDDKRMAAWLKANEVDTMMGRLRFDGPNNHGPDLSGVRQCIDRRWVTVWPNEIAAPGAKPILP